MRYLYLLIIFYSLKIYGQSVSPRFTAAQACGVMGVKGESYLNATKVGPDGYHYVTGTFSGTVTFGPYTLTTAGYEDVFVAKLDAAGKYIWVARAGGTNADIGNDLAIDSSGNVYVAGSFKSLQADFGSTTLSQFNTGYSKAFVAKLTSMGNWIWTVQAEGGYESFNDSAAGLALDKAGNIYVAGQFDSPSLNLGTLTVRNSDPSLAYDQRGQADFYAAKLSPSGSWLWAVGGGGINNDAAVDITLDDAQSVYVAGYFESTTAKFGSTTLTRTGNSNLVVAKLDATGAWQWVVPGGRNKYIYPASIVAAPDGTTFLTGQFTGFTELGLTSMESVGGYDAFAARLDPNGTWEWTARCGGSGNDYGFGLALDKTGNTYITGSFVSPTIDVGPTTLLNVSGGLTADFDLFVARLDPQGFWQWGIQAGGTGADFGRAITLDNQNGLYLAGYYTSSPAHFGPFDLAGNPAVNGGRVGFVAHLGNAVLASQTPTPVGASGLYPNPSKGTIWLTGLPAGQALTIYDGRGQLVHTARVPATTDTPLVLPTTLPSGLYVIRSGTVNYKLQIE